MSASGDLPNSVTSYDILKSFAIVLMIVDHVGLYFFPDIVWMRAVGRLCVPVWLFLIGYARSSELDRRIFWGSALLVAANVAIGWGVIPVNILGTILLARLVRDPLLKFIGSSLDRLVVISVFAAIMAPLTQNLFEYGTMAIIFAISGALLRRDNGRPKPLTLIYGLFALVTYIACQKVAFAVFTPVHVTFVAVGSAFVMASLIFFLPRFAKGMALPGGLPKKAVQFCGRHSLEIYVVHLMLLKAAWFAVQLISPR